MSRYCEDLFLSILKDKSINRKNISVTEVGAVFTLKLDRLISILVVLLRKERITAKELAEMFGVSVRTILRDVDAIDLAGIPIITFQGANGGIGIAEGYRLDRSVLNSDEMAAIVTMLKGVATTIPDSAHEILVEKLKNTLSASQLELLEKKTKQLVIDLSPWGGGNPDGEVIASIRKAIQDTRLIDLAYTDSAGVTTTRCVEPYSLVLKGQNWYLFAWCLLRCDSRFFKLSRIKEIVISESTFKARNISAEQIPNEWQSKDKLVELELILNKEMKRFAEDWFGGEKIELEDGSVLIKVMLPENNGLYGFLLSLGPGVEVVSPDYIRLILADLAGEIHKKYSIKT